MKKILAIAVLVCCLVLGWHYIPPANPTQNITDSAEVNLMGTLKSDRAANGAANTYSINTIGTGNTENVDIGSKVIFSGRMEMETTTFSAAYDNIDQVVKEFNAYTEHDNTGTSGMGDSQYAELTVRVPAAMFEKLISNLEEIENVTVLSKNLSTEDISEEYYDVEGRLANAKNKLQNLQKLAEEAENVQDMITIENSISDVQSTIEYLQGQMNRYDSKIQYSVLQIHLSEVNVINEHKAGYGNRLVHSLQAGFVEGIEYIGDFILLVAKNWLLILVVGGLFIGLSRIHKRIQRKSNELGNTQNKVDTTIEKNQNPADTTEKP